MILLKEKSVRSLESESRLSCIINRAQKISKSGHCKCFDVFSRIQKIASKLKAVNKNNSEVK